MSGRDVVRTLERLGFAVISQEGRHLKLRKFILERRFKVIVPLHRELARGTLASIIRQAGISFAELAERL